VLVEGGGEVHGAFLDAGLVDRVAMSRAPLLIAGAARRPWWAAPDASSRAPFGSAVSEVTPAATTS
jgi:diaminohydroxyphosphoribosylaminopyrimidine deaminase/5-amino-6-(5-phosphoribosylamino)uracil reductase